MRVFSVPHEVHFYLKEETCCFMQEVDLFLLCSVTHWRKLFVGLLCQMSSADHMTDGMTGCEVNLRWLTKGKGAGYKLKLLTYVQVICTEIMKDASGFYLLSVCTAIPTFIQWNSGDKMWVILIKLFPRVAHGNEVCLEMNEQLKLILYHSLHIQDLFVFNRTWNILVFQCFNLTRKR